MAGQVAGVFVPSLPHPPLPCFCFCARPAEAQASSFVSFASDRAPEPGLPVSACLAFASPYPHSATAHCHLARLAYLLSLLLPLCVACGVWGRAAFACFSWPHARSMFEHTHCTQVAGTSSVLPLPLERIATLPRSLLLAPPHLCVPPFSNGGGDSIFFPLLPGGATHAAAHRLLPLQRSPLPQGRQS